MEYETAAISSLKRQAGTVYDGRISQVKRETALIYRIQCGRIRGLIWYGRSDMLRLGRLQSCASSRGRGTKEVRT